MKNDKKRLQKIDDPFKNVEGIHVGSTKPLKKQHPESDEITVEVDTPDVGVTVAAFVLNDDHLTSGTEFGQGNANSEAVRNEIIKALREEGENFD